MNKLVLIGRLARETELRFTQAGLAVANNAIAITEGFGDKKKSHFINFSVFGKQAETFAEWTVKGQQIAIDGRLTTSTYEKDGRKITQVSVVADFVEFIERKRTPEFDSPKALKNDEIEIDDLPW